MHNLLKIQITFLVIISLLNYIQSCFEDSCEECSSEEYGKCTKCKNGYIYNNGNCNCPVDFCEKCSKKGCIKCIQGRYLIEGLCRKCIDGCAYCSNSETCDYCLSGFELTKNNKCKKNIFSILI